MTQSESLGLCCCAQQWMRVRPPQWISSPASVTLDKLPQSRHRGRQRFSGGLLGPLGWPNFRLPPAPDSSIFLQADRADDGGLHAVGKLSTTRGWLEHILNQARGPWRVRWPLVGAEPAPGGVAATSAYSENCQPILKGLR
jgi:hypothetical protein